MTRYAKRRDLSEPEIVDALLAAGCDVLRLNEIDLLVGRSGKNYLIECKTPGRATESRIRPIQRRLRESWRGQYAIVTTAEEALEAIQ